MPVTLGQSGALSLVRLEGSVGIGDAVGLKKLLLQALAPGNKVCISLEDSLDLDVTAMQLLWAAKHEAEKLGVAFTFAEPVPAELSTICGDAGFEKFAVSK